MGTPRFSVVIPTRERADTFQHCLRTCVEQDFDDFEVIVADNYSSAATREVVETIGSPRVRYFRAPRPLAMSANWEMGVSQASGEFVLVVGDDDGLLPTTLTRADALLRDSKQKVLRWNWCYYSWPNYIMPCYANGLEIPLERGFRIVQTAEYLQAVGNDQAWHPTLPMLYNAAVHRDILDQLRRTTGRVFSAVCPDVYSGMAIGYLVGEYGAVDEPLAMSGSSKKANGINLLVDPNSSVAREYWALNSEAGLDWHPLIPRVPALAAFYADSFLQAKDRLFPDDPDLTLDRVRLAQRCLETFNARDEVEWRIGIERIAGSLVDSPDLQAEFLRQAAGVPVRLAGNPELVTDQLFVGVRNHRLCLNAADFGVADVYGAAQLCQSILGSHNHAAELQMTQARLAKSEREAVELARTVSFQQLTLDRAWSCLPHRIIRKARHLFRSERRAG